MSLIKLGFGPYRQELTPELRKEFFPDAKPDDIVAAYKAPQFIKRPALVETPTPEALRAQKHGIMYLEPNTSRPVKRHEIVHYLRRNKLKNPPTFLNTLKEEVLAYWKQAPKATKLERAGDVLSGAMESTLHVHYPKILKWLTR